MNAARMRIPRNTRKSGFMTRPIHVVILPGLSEKYITNAKNTNVNMSCQSLKCDSPTIGAMPVVKDTDAHLGMAKSGPIVRYKTIAEQLRRRETHFDSFSDGVKIFTIGLAKKVLCANTIGKVWTAVSSMPQDQMSVVVYNASGITFCITYQIQDTFSVDTDAK